MALSDIFNELENRSSFGTTLSLTDGNLRIQEGTSPDRVAIMGVSSASESNARGTDYLIPTGVPFRLVTPSDMKYFKNADPDVTESEITLAFEDVYNAGGRSYELVIVSRTVGQLGGDIVAGDTILPVSTIYTNKVTATGVMGAHPTLNTNFSCFEHNGDYVVAGGERPNTPALGNITSGAAAVYVIGDYIQFTHTDLTVHGFWFNKGGDSEPAALTSAVAAGTAGSTSTEIDASVGTADAMRTLIASTITASTALPITGYDGASGVADLESDEDGVAGNAWILTEVGSGAGVTAFTTPAGGAATNTISRRLMKLDPATDLWTNILDDTSQVAVRLVVGTRDSVAVRETAVLVQLVGGMTTILGGADTAIATVDEITFAGTANSDATGVAAGTSVTGARTTFGEAAVVDAGGTIFLIGGQSGAGTRLSTIHTYVASSGVTSAAAGTAALAAATRWMCAYYMAAHNRIYIFGGETATGSIATTQIIDVAAEDIVTGVTASNMSEAKYNMGYIGLNGAGWSFGGVAAAGDSKRVERFDPDSLSWQRKSDMTSADAGGCAAVVSSHIMYADGLQGYDYNVGLGNLSDQYVGFPSSFPFEIQVNWEIMSVTGVTTTRARGRDIDAFIVTRAQKGSTAQAHSDRVDIVEGPEVLYTDLESAYEKMVDSSRADYVLPPARAVADCPYLPEGINFAYQVGYYCYIKGLADRAVMAMLPVFPPTEVPYAVPTEAENTAWIDSMIAFDRTNHLSESIWSIGDGINDTVGDGKPDTYAFYATTDETIPVGSPPVTAGNVVIDSNKVAVDLGKHLHIVYPYGFATSQAYKSKFGSGNDGMLRSGVASFTGTVSVLPPEIGSTNTAVVGFTPYTLLSFVQENKLNRRRYLGIVNPANNGLRWNTGYTWAWNVNQFNRSDYVLGSTFRKMVALSRLLRDVVSRYYGKPINGPHLNAFQIDVGVTIAGAIEAGIVGPATNFDYKVSRADKIIGKGTLAVSAEFDGELTHVDMPMSQFVN